MMVLLTPWIALPAAADPDVAVSVAVSHEADGDAVDEARPAEDRPHMRIDSRHGFRIGYAYYPEAELDDPHLFVMGYETSQRMYGGAGLDVLLVENVVVGGLNQSLVIPSGNLLIGASVRDTWEFGVGPNFAVVPSPRST
ncbi:MAG: hypothetical protein R3F59_04715 [Myxococcota bacterium]